MNRTSSDGDPAGFLQSYVDALENGHPRKGCGIDPVLIELGWLADNPRPTARPGLERLANHPEPAVRAAALKALAALGDS